MGRINSLVIHGVANIGVRPTLDSTTTERRLEVHLFDFAQNIYGSEMEVVFAKFIRPEQRFSSLEELRIQIARDAEAAAKFFS